MVTFLLKFGCAVNTRDKKERTALHWAAFMGHEDVVWSILQRSADVNARDKNVSVFLFLLFFLCVLVFSVFHCSLCCWF